MLDKEQIEKLYEWLQGKETDTKALLKSPRISNLKAWSIIYFLQEDLRIADDNVERCRHCKDLVDVTEQHFGFSKFHCECCQDKSNWGEEYYIKSIMKSKRSKNERNII